MILADTTIWVDHLNHGDARLAQLLAGEQIGMHMFVVGELGLGTLPQWERVKFRLMKLPPVRTVGDQSVLTMIETRGLRGSGIGYVDAHLLASCLMGNGIQLWTRDTRLAKAAALLGVSAATA
jgi:predicted nucleic acid-binding protein